jgi:hypothetical protein
MPLHAASSSTPRPALGIVDSAGAALSSLLPVPTPPVSGTPQPFDATGHILPQQQLDLEQGEQQTQQQTLVEAQQVNAQVQQIQAQQLAHLQQVQGQQRQRQHQHQQQHQQQQQQRQQQHPDAEAQLAKIRRSKFRRKKG